MCVSAALNIRLKSASLWNVCVCACERERECECACERERECACERERVRVCVRERASVRARESECVCVSERESVCVCMCVCAWEWESMRERESVCVRESERERVPLVEAIHQVHYQCKFIPPVFGRVGHVHKNVIKGLRFSHYRENANLETLSVKCYKYKDWWMYVSHASSCKLTSQDICIQFLLLVLWIHIK